MPNIKGTHANIRPLGIKMTSSVFIEYNEKIPKYIQREIRTIGGIWIEVLDGWIIKGTDVDNVVKLLDITDKKSKRKKNKTLERDYIDIGDKPDKRTDLREFYSISSNREIISNLRKYIYYEIFTKNRIKSVLKIETYHLTKLYKLYDKYIFGNQLKRQIRKTNSKLILELSERKTKSVAGKCSKDGCIYKISMFKYIFTGLNNNISAGVKCKTELDCFLITFEHELVHLMLSIGLYPPNDKHGKNFKYFVKNMFGHLSTTNSLGVEVSDKTLTRSDLHLGDIVTFMSRTENIRGKILKLNPKKAVVLSFDDNTRYIIPYTLLHKK